MGFLKNEVEERELQHFVKMRQSGIYDKTKVLIKSKEENFIKFRSEIANYSQIKIAQIGAGTMFGEIDVILKK